MNRRDAAALIQPAVPRIPGTWADIGAGDGTFTRALAELLGPTSRIYAVDRDPRALRTLDRGTQLPGIIVTPVRADFTRPFKLPGFEDPGLDGMVLANALHFARGAAEVLARLVGMLRPGGRVVVVEYDGRSASPWVPHPIPSTRLPRLAAFAGLSEPAIVASRPSAFGGTLYVATAERRRSS